MIDWLKFFPFALRDEPNPSEVRGPYFSKPVPIKWQFGDSFLHFTAPRSNAVFSFSGRSRSVDRVVPKKRDILKALGPRPNTGDWDNPVNRWNYNLIYFNAWYFVGPWFCGAKARFSVRANLIETSRLSSFFNRNMFHPKVFESAVASILDCHYGHHDFNTKTKAHFRGPLNWQVLPISNSIQAVVCDVHCVGNGTVEDPEVYRKIYIPITSSHILNFNFDFCGADLKNDTVRAKPLLALCNSIIDSIRLDVGPETQAEWDKVKAACPDMSITETFGELQWPLAPEKPPKEKREVDITPQSAGFEKLRSI
ncbi:hypothetical protein QFX18_18965 [Saccharophagus degradans]|uniref:hypothetical protein n=1 Tax=Saccharophagus degradans TaxID=86304 RepID=UPI002477F134|nr:hypothetical protein [Saccharophagus degradans]WGO98090.1 hypothetical protein QFX18_18965 [Saccharophagus degradans]